MNRLAAVVLVVAACAGSGNVVEGRLVAVEGDLTAIESFVILTDEGERIEFAAEATATFHGGPLSHMRDHLISGTPIVVFFTERDGELIATGVEDSS